MASLGLNWILASLMVLTALYHFGHLIAASSTAGRFGGRPDIDLTHGAMGIVMAVMLLGALGPGIEQVWAAVFAVPCVWFLVAAVRRERMQHLPQFAVCAAMVFMLVVAAGGAGMPSMAGMPGMTGISGGSGSQAFRVIGLALLVAMVGVTALGAGTLVSGTRLLVGSSGGRLVAAAGHQGSPGLAGGRTVPRLGAGCQLAMNATTVYMLIMVLS